MPNLKPELSRTVPRLSLNRTEVAMSIGVSPNTVDVMVQEGFLPKPRRWKNRKVWLVQEIVASMADWPEDGSTPKAAKPPEEDWTATV